MASLITPQFEQYIAQQTINKGTVVFDEFVFANIPGLTAENLKNHLTMPQAAHIVHRQAVSQSGVVNENAVVYSVTIGTEVGDFDFNFIGLVNKSKNMLAVAIQTTPVKKVRNKNAVQGNSITRNVLLEFRGAKALTNINVTAQTWQIDFTVRLHGIDEKIRLTNRDLYGRAVFFDDSFLVKRKSGNDYTIEPGVAYVEGVRANMTALENINAANLPCSIYLDVVHHCTVTGAYETEIKFLKANKADYTDTTNRPHYVQILADIDRNGVVTDRRLSSPFLGINPLDLDDTTPNKADKRGHTHRLPLAGLIKRGIVKLYSGYNSDAEDLAATPKAIKTLKAFIDALTRNLGNYIPNSKKSSRVDSSSADDVATSAAVKTAYDKGVEAKNAADGAQRSANDGINRANNAQQSAEAANTNANTRVAKSGDTMTGNLSFKQGDYSGISFYNNDDYYLRLEGNPKAGSNMLTFVYRQPNGENVAVASLPKKNGTIAYVDDVVRKTGDSMKGTLTFTDATENYDIANYSWRMPIKFQGDTFIGNEVTGIGFNNNGALNLGGRKNSPEFIATIDSEGIYTGGVVRATGHTAKAYGQGAFVNQWTDKKAPYVVHNPNANGQNIYYPFIKGFNSNGNQYGTAFSFGYMTPGTINQFGSGAIHLLTDSGNGKIWWFGHDGVLRGDDFVTTDGKRLSDLPKERLIWQGSTDNPITVNAQIGKGVLFVLMDTPHGANANRPIWFSAPIEQCHDTRIGEYDTGGTGGDYNYVTLALLHRNGNNITITPQSDGRNPRLKKVVVFG